MVRNTTDTSRLGNSDWEPIPMPGSAQALTEDPQGQPQSQNSIMGTTGNQPSQPGEAFDVTHHAKGFLFLLGFLIFHFLCFLVTLSMGLGIGILSGALHEICWDSVMVPFWQVYVALISIVVLIELSFRVGRGTKLNLWLDALQRKYYLELFYVPRVLYFWGYTAAIILLFYAYYGAHHIVTDNKTLKSNNSSKPPGIRSPLWMGQTDDHFHYSAIFFVALCYMIYVTAKENDWMTYRKALIEDGDTDPISRGSIGSFALYLIVHIFIMFLYVLPLIGCVYLFRQFEFGARVTFFWESVMAVIVGIGAIFIERRAPFPTEPLHPPNYAYENHLRIRIIILQLWMIPLACGNYFESSRTSPINAQNDDFLIFTVEVGLGIVQAVKVFGNDIFIHLHVRRMQGNVDTVLNEETQYDYIPGESLTSITSLNEKGQEGSVGNLTAELQHVSRKPDVKPEIRGSSVGPSKLETFAGSPKSGSSNPFESDENIPFEMAEMGNEKPQSDSSLTLIMKREHSLVLNNNSNVSQRSNSESQFFK